MAKMKAQTDEQVAVRSLLMRIYHSRLIGEAFYHANLANGEAPALEAKGWIERHGDGWRMTDEGVTAWAEMNSAIFNSSTYYVSGVWDELRARVRHSSPGAGL